MAVKFNFVWVTGDTLTFGVYYDNSGTMTAREAGTSMTEEPAASGVYKGSATTMLESDIVAVSNTGGVIGSGEYLLDPMNTKLDTIDANVDLVLLAQNKVNNVYDETDEPLGSGEEVLIGGPSHC